MDDQKNQSGHYDPRQDSVLLLLGELRGDVKAVLVNQEKISDRLKDAEQKIEDHRQQMSHLKNRQAYMVGYAVGAGGVVGSLLMVFKDKLNSLIT